MNSDDGGGPPDFSKPATPKQSVQWRRTEVGKLLARGWNVVRIAERMGLPVNTVSQDKLVLEAEWKETQLENAERAAALDLTRLDMAIDRLLFIIDNPKVGVFNLTRAIEQLTRIVQLRGEILGYRQGVTVDIESYVRAVAEANGYDPEAAVELAQKVVISIK